MTAASYDSFEERLAALRLKFQGYRDRKYTLQEIADLYNVNPWHVSNVLDNDNYKPTIEIAEKFKLGHWELVETCACGEVHTKRHPRQTNYKDLFAMPVNVLRWKIENREPIQGRYPHTCTHISNVPDPLAVQFK